MAKTAVARKSLTELAAAHVSTPRRWVDRLPDDLRELFLTYCRDVASGAARTVNHCAAHRAFSAECAKVSVAPPSRETFSQEVSRQCASL